MTLRAQGFLGATGWRGTRFWGQHHAAPGRCGTARHDQRAGPVAGTGRLRPAGADAARADRAGLLAFQQAVGLRVLGARGVRAAGSSSGPTSRSGAAPSGPGARAGTRATREVCEKVLARIRAEGPLTATQLGGAKRGGPWWDWSDVKIAAEWLLDTGEVICARRTGWRRVYDLPERVLPGELLAADPADLECVSYLAGVAARALGVVTHSDLVDYHRLAILDQRAGPAHPAGRRRRAGAPGWFRSPSPQTAAAWLRAGPRRPGPIRRRWPRPRPAAGTG